MDYNLYNHYFQDLEDLGISPDRLQNSDTLADVTMNFGVLIDGEEL